MRIRTSIDGVRVRSLTIRRRGIGADARASRDYRLQVAGNLLTRFWLETREVDPLPAAATSVFSGMGRVLPQGS